MSHHPQAASNIWEWTARIRFNQYELGTSFSVCVFLCNESEIPTTPRDWQTCPVFVGATHAYVSGGESGGYGYGSPAEDVTQGFVHLNSGIVKMSGLRSLEPEVVKPYLKNKLQWKVQKANSEPATLESLETVVIVTPLTLLPGEMFPIPGEPCQYNDITYGKPGGSSDP